MKTYVVGASNDIRQHMFSRRNRKYQYFMAYSAIPRAKAQNITKTYLHNFDPLKPTFYIVKLGFTGVYIIFLISAQNIDCGYFLEPPR